MVDGGEPGVDFRDEGEHTGKNVLLEQARAGNVSTFGESYSTLIIVNSDDVKSMTSSGLRSGN